MDMLEVGNFASDFDNTGALALTSPLELLFSEYRRKKADIERIAAYVAGETDVIHYFMSGAQLEGRGHQLSATGLFQSDHAIRALDASYWSQAMSLTDVLDYMPTDKRNDWNKQIRQHETPPFDPESVKATLRGLLMQRQSFFAERIDGIFRALSGEHITNSPAGFGKRMILSNITSCYGSTDRVGYINDLRCVISKFMERDEPKWYASSKIVEEARHMHGQWLTLDGGSLRLRCYLKGTAHLEVHPDMAWRLNAMLSSLYPMAIPPEFRRKPTKAQKAPKDFVMMGRPLPFATLELLAGMKTGTRFIKQENNWRQPYRREEIPNSMQFEYGTLAVDKAPTAAREEAERVLAYIGGVKDGPVWLFEYRANDVIAEIVRTGCLPDRKTHQYYPTPKPIAELVAELAQIGEAHSCLEPSAGQGGLCDFLRPANTTCVEISPVHCKVLEGKGFKPVCADFLQWSAGRTFDRIVMNPPFSEGRALIHLQKAASLLAAGGRLVAVLPSSYRGKDLIAGLSHEWSESFQGEFEGTGVAVTVLALTKA
ncbi:DUF4942 domain-containing protein [Noviherbaspirillum sp. CPCC 100848]|uniref:DUF4942 domain-containing protein n=1 Tax=Noviherbaspirillum album TaxID=3080276 RepID=A0ABU6J3P6_9BURK|nr:DUF4942 domain-containing protein [Noviherbaspirillum sp. CPCC 100848]MEC4718261.1 DUF4942 domain-containing protein [Noviherbaspirillum sp. CPCC 100848]